jgi:hypothetical protein
MYIGRVVLNKLDGLGDVVCHYRQKAGICTGVCLEWLRRVMLKEQEELLPTSAGVGYGIGLGAKEKTTKRETRWAGTQDGISRSLRRAFQAGLLNPLDHSIDTATRDELDLLDSVEPELEEAKKKGTQGGLYKVPASILRYAKDKRLTGLHSTGLTSHEVESVAKSAKREHRTKIELAYQQWRKTCPMEIGVFKECSQDVEDVTFDAKTIELRTRFNGLQVIESANALQLNTTRAFTAMNQAMQHPQFTLKRGVMFGVLERSGGGHSHAVYFSQVKPARYLWIDPNYGVWKMTHANILRAMSYLYDHTDVRGEKGVYQVNGIVIPTAFEYSIWGIRG